MMVHDLLSIRPTCHDRDLSHEAPLEIDLVLKLHDSLGPLERWALRPYRVESLGPDDSDPLYGLLG